MGAWFGVLWAKLRRLPIARWIKPFWKAALKEAAQAAGSRLQERVKAEIVKHGPRAVDRNIDKWQSDILHGMAALSVPAWARARLEPVILEQGDAFQDRLKVAVKDNVPGAIDALFLSWGAAIEDVIDHL